MERCLSSCLMIRNCRYVRSNCRYRIPKGCSVLNPYTIHCIGIVTAPDLWCIIQHSRVKTTSTTTAAFDQKVWIAAYNTLQEIIKSKHVVILHTALFFCCHRIYFCHTSVHIPFYIFDISLIEHLTHLLINSIHNFFSRKIKEQLVSSFYRFSSRNLNCPVRMFTVKITVFIYHLRLKPEPEFNT